MTKRTILALMLATSLPCLPPASAQSDTLSAASELSTIGVAHVLGGGAEVLSGGMELTIATITASAGGVIVLTQGVSAAGQLTFSIGEEAFRASGVAIGTTLTIVETGAGMLLTAGDTIVGFLADGSSADHFHRTRVSG